MTDAEADEHVKALRRLGASFDLAMTGVSWTCDGGTGGRSDAVRNYREVHRLDRPEVQSAIIAAVMRMRAWYENRAEEHFDDAARNARRRTQDQNTKTLNKLLEVRKEQIKSRFSLVPLREAAEEIVLFARTKPAGSMEDGEAQDQRAREEFYGTLVKAIADGNRHLRRRRLLLPNADVPILRARFDRKLARPSSPSDHWMRDQYLPHCWIGIDVGIRWCRSSWPKRPPLPERWLEFEHRHQPSTANKKGRGRPPKTKGPVEKHLKQFLSETGHSVNEPGPCAKAFVAWYAGKFPREKELKVRSVENIIREHAF